VGKLREGREKQKIKPVGSRRVGEKEAEEQAGEEVEGGRLGKKIG
jgi:hypothetical protein